MSLGLERSLVNILDAVRGRTNVTFKRFHPINAERGIYIDCPQIVRLSPASTRRLSGVSDIIIDAENGGSDPVRKALGSAKKCSGDFEHAALRVVRNSAHAGIHAVRSAEASLLTGYNQTAHLELTSSQQFQLHQAQQHLPEVPVIAMALQIVGRAMAKVDLTTPQGCEENNILAADRRGNVIHRRLADTLLAGIGGLLLGPGEESE